MKWRLLPLSFHIDCYVMLKEGKRNGMANLKSLVTVHIKWEWSGVAFSIFVAKQLGSHGSKNNLICKHDIRSNPVAMHDRCSSRPLARPNLWFQFAHIWWHCRCCLRNHHCAHLCAKCGDHINQICELDYFKSFHHVSLWSLLNSAHKNFHALMLLMLA